jgi:O-antigen/teichoic acid export membrane protein
MNIHFSRLIKGTGIMALAGLLEKGVAFFLLPLYTHYLTPADYGAVELFIVLLTIMDIVVQQGLVSAVFKRIAFDKGENEIEDYRTVMGTAIIYVLGTGLLVGIAMIVFAGQLSPLLFDQPGYDFLMAVGALTLITRVVEKILIVPLRSAQRYTTCAAISFVIFCSKLTGNLVFLVHFDAGFASLLYGQCAGAVVGIIAAAIAARKYVSFRFDRAELRVLTKFGHPLIFSAIGLLVLNSTDRVLLKYFGENTLVGLYSIASKLGFAVDAFLLGPFRSTWPTVYYKIAREDGAHATFGLFALRFFGLGLVATLAAHWFAPYALWILTTPAYYPAASAVGLIVASVFLYTLNDILKVGMNITARTHLLPIRVVLAGVVNVVFGFLLIPVWGIVGAALATIVAYAFMDWFTIWACRDFYRIDYDWAGAAKLTVFALAVFVLHRVLPESNLVVDIVLKTVLLIVLLVVTMRTVKLDLRPLLRWRQRARA